MDMEMSTIKNPIKNRKINIGLVGCGRISKNHIGSFEKHSADLNLQAVCDINNQALDEAVKSTGARGYNHLSEMLGKEASLDVVCLTTPSGVHAAQAIEVAKSGRHIICEKPMATRWEDGLNMVKAADDAGVLLYVVKQNRRNSTLQLLKNAVDQNRFGKIYMVNINVFWTRPQDYYDAAPWRGTWEFDGGAFMNQASHYVDLLHWLIGPMEKVFSFTATLARKIEAEDSGVVALKWKNGAMGTMNVTMLTYPRNLEGSITIIGEKGTVRIGGVAVNEITNWEFSDSRPEDEKVKSANYETTSVYGFGHPLYYENVVKSLRGEEPPAVDGHQGLQSLELLTAIYRSARNGVAVNLPLEI